MHARWLSTTTTFSWCDQNSTSSKSPVKNRFDDESRTKPTFASDVVGMAHASNIVVQVLERVLGVARAHGHGLRDLLVDDDIDFDTLLGLAPQNTVKTPLLVVCRGATEVQLRCEPPIL